MACSGYDFGLLCRHVDKETPTPIECSVEGTLPDWVNGSFVYNGPGLTKVGKKEYLHCFDSASILQKVTISKGSQLYMSKFQRTETFKRNEKAGTIVVGEFGTAPEIIEKPGFFTKLRKMADVESIISDNSVVSIEQIAGKLYTTGETPFLHELDVDTLEIKNRMSMYKTCSVVTVSPHPVRDAQGNSYTVGQGVSLTGPKYTVVKFPADKSPPEVVARLAPRWRMSPCYMHSLGITDNYIVLIEVPLAVSLSDVMSDVFHNIAFLDAMKWHEETVIIHVLELKTMKPLKKKFVMKTMFHIHFSNCYEDTDGNIVMDLPCYEDAIMLHQMFIDTLRKPKGDKNKEFSDRFFTKMVRVVLPLDDSSSTEVSIEGQVINPDAVLENPIINPLYARKKHRYIYGISISSDYTNSGQASKLDVETGDLKIFKEDMVYTSDPIFLPTPGAVDEDDGFMVIFVVRSDRPKFGSLVFLNAKDMSVSARVNFEPDSVVSLPMHGIFVPSN